MRPFKAKIMDNQLETDEMNFQSLDTPVNLAPIPLASFFDSNVTHSRFTFDYYKKYFDVDTKDVLGRIKQACTPTDRQFLHNINNAELYGPIWMPASISFFLFACGNIHNLIVIGSDYKYNFAALVSSFVLLNLFVFALPFGIGYVRSETSPPMMKMMMLFAYSLSYIIPSSILGILFSKYHLVAFLVFAGAGAYSIFNKFLFHVQSIDNRVKGMDSPLIAGGIFFVVHFLVHIMSF